MTDKKLVKLASDFRKGILGRGKSDWMCFAICAPLVNLLELYGVRATMVEVDLGDMNHFWLKLDDGRALDPTADQFNRYGLALPPVYLGKPLSIHGAP